MCSLCRFAAMGRSMLIDPTLGQDRLPRRTCPVARKSSQPELWRYLSHHRLYRWFANPFAPTRRRCVEPSPGVPTGSLCGTLDLPHRIAGIFIPREFLYDLHDSWTFRWNRGLRPGRGKAISTCSSNNRIERTRVNHKVPSPSLSARGAHAER